MRLSSTVRGAAVGLVLLGSACTETKSPGEGGDAGASTDSTNGASSAISTDSSRGFGSTDDSTSAGELTVQLGTSSEVMDAGATAAADDAAPSSSPESHQKE